MNFDLTEDQHQYRDVTRRFLEANCPLANARELWNAPDAVDRGYWEQAATLGWTSSFVPDEYGGGSVSGQPAQDAAIVAEEMGRLVAPGPLLPVNVIAAAIAIEGTPLQQATFLPQLLNGRSIATWALAEDGAAWSGERPELATTIEPDGPDVVVTGSKAYVESAAQAELFLLTARTGDHFTQMLVPADAPGLEVIRGRSIDVTRRFGRIRLDALPLPSSHVIGRIGGADDALERQLQLAITLQCAETVGAADRALEMTLAYARDRHAFGRPIASFQALKHRLADMLQWLEFSKAITEALASEVDRGVLGARALASVAKAYVSDRCLDVVDECVQMSGGIGVTWEHDLHLYSRRIAVNRALYGTPEQHKERICCILMDSDFRT